MKPILAFLLLATVSMAEEQVFFAFDDHSIPWQHNLKLTLEPVRKHPDNPVLRRGPEGAPDHGHAILYGTVLKEGDTFRMWYLGMHETQTKSGQAPGWWRPMCYAESKDGVHWTKPELGLVEFNGSKKNNICLIESELFSMTRINDYLSVLHDPADPDPSRRYKCAFIAHMPFAEVKGGRSKIGPDERRWGATICATSADGLRWKVVGDRPANAGGERFEASALYRFGDFYYTTGQLISPWTWRPDGSPIGRVMLAYRSPDFVNWSQAKAFSYARPGQLSEPPVKGQQMHMGAGIWNRRNVLIGLHGMWQDADQPPPKGESWNFGVRIDLGLVVSNDGIHFREPVPGFKVIPRGGDADWDNIGILQSNGFVNEGDQTLIWYSHWDTGSKLKNMEIGLATLRRDGFGSLSPQVPGNGGHFVTNTFTAREIALNVEGIMPEAPLTARLLDHLDRPVPDYEVSLTRNGLHEAIAFPQPLPAPTNQKLALRLDFPAGSQARVYAVYLQP